MGSDAAPLVRDGLVLRELLTRLPWRRAPAKRALVLAGGGVIGGMYEVGVLAALD